MALTVSKCHTFIECACSYRLWDAYALYLCTIFRSFIIFVPHSMLKTFRTSTVLNKLIQSIIMQMFKFPFKSIAGLRTKSFCFGSGSAKESAHQSTHAFQWNLININDKNIQTSINKENRKPKGFPFDRLIRQIIDCIAKTNDQYFVRSCSCDNW